MRKQRPRGSTTRQAVVEAALAVVDNHGLEALTIRRVADHVGAPPMSLYTHFANKNELLDLMYTELSSRMYRDQGYEAWQTELLALSHRIRGILLEHPNWAPLLSRPAPPLAVPLRERVLKMMVEEGASTEQAFRALSSVALVAIGMALVELAFRQPDGESAAEMRYQQLREWLASQADEQHGIMRDAVSNIPRFSMADMFEFTSHALIEGLKPGTHQRKNDS